MAAEKPAPCWPGDGDAPNGPNVTPGKFALDSSEERIVIADAKVGIAGHAARR